MTHIQLKIKNNPAGDLMIRMVLLIILMLITSCVFAADWYVRVDGGTREQCNGHSNTPYSGNGQNKDCAVKHLFELLDPRDETVHIAGGDTIFVGAGSYEMGRHAEYNTGRCDISWAYDCTLPALPSGNSTNRTRILGAGWDKSCSTPPELWGSGRASTILNLEGTSRVELNCLNITDHSSCISNHPDASIKCDRSAPYDKPFADKGIKFTDGSNFIFSNLNIHGLVKGIHAGR